MMETGIRTPRRALVAALLAFLTLPAFSPIRHSEPFRILPIIATTWGSPAHAEDAVRNLGGTVTHDLPIINGFSAKIPAASLPAFVRVSGLRTLSLDRKVRVMGTVSSGIKSVYTKAVRANNMWGGATGATGSGVTVALIDTGVADVPDLAGRVLTVTNDLTGETAPCVNFSGEPDCGDSYGHGTFLAGIIAGNGAASGGTWKGVAPEANIVSIKIGGRDGSADVSAVLAAMQWTVSFKDRYGIKVVNLSLGTNSTQTYRTDPLNYAVERAWDAGLAVVVSASNTGPAAGTISKPGDDPLVITVGAVDDRGTAGTGDDMLPNFSSRGPTAADGLAKPDVVAPGAHIVSLRAIGSAVDVNFPNYVDGAYRQGSGTSMSAAVVSGSIALMLQANPTMTPDRVKYALTSTARGVASTDHMAVGSGEIDTYAATFSAPPGFANVGVARSSGLGSLDASRGDVSVMTADPTHVVIDGMLTAQLLLYDPIAFTGGQWYGGQWYGGQWYGGQWYATQWYGGQWYGGQWYGGQWYGEMDGGQWYGGQWYGGQWYGSWE
jgi:serine protease AprX